MITKLRIVGLFVGLVLSFYLFELLWPVAEFPHHEDNNINGLFAFTLESKQPLVDKQTELSELTTFPGWGSRVASIDLAGKVWDWTYRWVIKHSQVICYNSTDSSGVNHVWNVGKDYIHFGGYQIPGYEVVFSAYYAAWFFLLCLLLVFYRPDAVFVMLGTLAACCQQSHDRFRDDIHAVGFASNVLFHMGLLVSDEETMAMDCLGDNGRWFVQGNSRGLRPAPSILFLEAPKYIAGLDVAGTGVPAATLVLCSSLPYRPLWVSSASLVRKRRQRADESFVLV